MKTNMICFKKCGEMLASSSVLTIYNGKYMLSSGILLDSFEETHRMLTMVYENTMGMLDSVPLSIEWFRGTIEYLSFNPHISIYEFVYRGSCINYLMSKRFDPKIFGITDMHCVYVQFGLVFVDGYFRIVSFRV